MRKRKRKQRKRSQLSALESTPDQLTQPSCSFCPQTTHHLLHPIFHLLSLSSVSHPYPLSMFPVILHRCIQCHCASRIVIRNKSYSHTVILPRTTFRASLDPGNEVRLQSVSGVVGLFITANITVDHVGWLIKLVN